MTGQFNLMQTFLFTYPWLIKWGATSVPWHVILETAAIFIGFRYFLYLRNQQGDPIESPHRIWIIIGAIFGAVAGSRIVGGLENPGEMLRAENIALHFYMNKTMVGGLLGGLAGVEIIKKFIKERSSSGDLFVFPLLLAIIIGRIGCFSMGVYEETYGIETSLPWGMDLGDGIVRHPVTLYEIVFLLMFWLLEKRIEKRTILKRGYRFRFFMISYLLFRFILDFIKPHYKIVMGLSTIQLACMGGLIYYIILFLTRHKLNSVTVTKPADLPAV